MATAGGFEPAARAFGELVSRIPDDAWPGPGLGVWDLRSLVGHASNALSTVITYLRTTATAEVVRSPEEYYTAIQQHAAALAPQIAERGRQAGERLGDKPADAVAALVVEVLAELEKQQDPLIETRIGGMRLRAYLPTRTFELVVHSLDIAASAGVEFTPPADVLAETAALAARIACREGSGSAVIRALTGRAPLPAGFSVVR